MYEKGPMAVLSRELPDMIVIQRHRDRGGNCPTTAGTWPSTFLGDEGARELGEVHKTIFVGTAAYITRHIVN